MATFPGITSPVSSARVDSTGLTVSSGTLAVTARSPSWSGTLTLSGGAVDCGSSWNTFGNSSDVFPALSPWNLTSGVIRLFNSNTAGYTIPAAISGAATLFITQAENTTYAGHAIVMDNLSNFTGTLQLWSNQLAANFRSIVGVKAFPTSSSALIHMQVGAAEVTVTGVQKRVHIPSGALTQSTPVNFRLGSDSNTLLPDCVFGLWAEQASGQAVTFTGNITRQDGASNIGSATYTFTLGGTNTDLNTISGVVSSAAGMKGLALKKEDAGRWVLSGSANTHAAGTGISGGFLRVTAAGAMGSGSVVSTGGTTELSGGITVNNAVSITSNDPGFASGRGAVQSISGNNTISSTTTVTVAGSTCAVGADSDQTLTIDASVIGSAAEFVTRGAGTVTLTSYNNSFSGNFYAAANVTSVTNINPTGSVGVSSGPLHIAEYGAGLGGTLRYVGTVETATTRGVRIVRDRASAAGYVYTLENAGTGTGYWRFNSGANGFSYRDTWAHDVTLQLSGSPASGQTAHINLILGDPSGGGKLNLLKTGAGSWRIGATPANTGTTEVNAGTLIGDHDSATPSPRFGGGSVRLNSGGTLKTLTGSAQRGRMSYASGLRLNGGTLQIGGT